MILFPLITKRGNMRTEIQNFILILNKANKNNIEDKIQDLNEAIHHLDKDIINEISEELAVLSSTKLTNNFRDFLNLTDLQY